MSSDDYIIGGVTVSGVRFLDTNALIGISGLRLGQEITIPGEATENSCSETVAAGTLFRCQDYNHSKSLQILYFSIFFCRSDQGYPLSNITG